MASGRYPSLAFIRRSVFFAAKETDRSFRTGLFPLIFHSVRMLHAQCISFTRSGQPRSNWPELKPTVVLTVCSGRYCSGVAGEDPRMKTVE